MSDEVQIVQMVLSFLSAVFVGLMAYYTRRLDLKAKDAAEKVAEVAVVQSKVSEKASAISTAIAENTALTVDVQRQTNGAREKHDELLIQAVKDIASQGLAIGILQTKLVEAQAKLLEKR